LQAFKVLVGCVRLSLLKFAYEHTPDWFPQEAFDGMVGTVNEAGATKWAHTIDIPVDEFDFVARESYAALEELIILISEDIKIVFADPVSVVTLLVQPGVLI